LSFRRPYGSKTGVHFRAKRGFSRENRKKKCANSKGAILDMLADDGPKLLCMDYIR
jgi:hypothetical protein